MKAVKVIFFVMALLSAAACAALIYVDKKTDDLMLFFGFREEFVSWVLFLLVPAFLGLTSLAILIDKIRNGLKRKWIWGLGTVVLVGSAVLMFCLSKNEDMYIRARKVESPDGKHSICYVTKKYASKEYYEYYRRVGTFCHDYLFSSEEIVDIEWGDGDYFYADGDKFMYSPYDEK